MPDRSRPHSLYGTPKLEGRLLGSIGRTTGTYSLYRNSGRPFSEIEKDSCGSRPPEGSLARLEIVAERLERRIVEYEPEDGLNCDSA